MIANIYAPNQGQLTFISLILDELNAFAQGLQPYTLPLVTQQCSSINSIRSKGYCTQCNSVLFGGLFILIHGTIPFILMLMGSIAELTIFF